jgi:hypothetical protein
MAARDIIHAHPQGYSPIGPERITNVPYLVSVLKAREIDRTRFGPRRRSADVVVSLGIPLAVTDTGYVAHGRVLDDSDRNALQNLFLTLGSFVIGPRAERVSERRQTFYGLPENGLLATAGGPLWTTTHVHTLAPGDFTASVEFETLSGNVEGATQAEIRIPDFDADSLQLSDLVMAYGIEEASSDAPSAPNRLHRNGLDIEPAPWAVYAVDQPIYVYFEMYNLQLGAGGATDVEVQVGLVPSDAPGGIPGFFNRLFGGEEEGVAVTSSYVGSSIDDGQYVIVDASGQTPGTYELIVRVRDMNSGTTSENRRTVILEDSVNPSDR